MAIVNFKVNGKAYSIDADQDMPVLYSLMHDLKLNGPKFGCGQSECGACTVLLDGAPVRSCQTPMSDVAGHEITTIEGLGTASKPHPIQLAFMIEQAAQCGYCISGPMLYGKAFIDSKPKATQAEIEDALSGLLCRCYTHTRMIKALVRYQQGVK
jgi:nicotinate dehydrogenase subunit A